VVLDCEETGPSNECQDISKYSMSDISTKSNSIEIWKYIWPYNNAWSYSIPMGPHDYNNPFSFIDSRSNTFTAN